MTGETNFTAIVEKINKAIPIHSMWDGFWIHSFKRKTLIVSCSFDCIYYRNFDLVFKQVIFFNIPANWRDTDIPGDDLLRLASKEEFEQQQLNFDPQAHLIFAIDMQFNYKDRQDNQVFFIVAKHVYLLKCDAANCNPVPEYTDPYADELFPCKKNKVGAKQVL